MCNKCGCENITTAFMCENCGNDCQPVRTTSGTVPVYFDSIPCIDYSRVRAKRTLIGKVIPLYQGAV